MEQEEVQTEGKGRYEPPHLKTISLRPEEAVLGHCKIAGQANQPGGGICALTCFNSGS